MVANEEARVEEVSIEVGIDGVVGGVCVVTEVRLDVGALELDGRLEDCTGVVVLVVEVVLIVVVRAMVLDDRVVDIVVESVEDDLFKLLDTVQWKSVQGGSG